MVNRDVYIAVAYPEEGDAWILGVALSRELAYSAIRDFIQERIDAGIYTADEAPLPPLNRRESNWSISSYLFEIEVWKPTEPVEIVDGQEQG